MRTTHGPGRLFASVLDTVGDTPCIRVNNVAPPGVRMYVKAEAFNPAGSVKDRLALNIIEAAERNGTLKRGQTVVEATSGNTGIGLAMVCAQKGYHGRRGASDLEVDAGISDALTPGRLPLFAGG